MTTLSGFNAMGHPIPEPRKQAAYNWLRTMFSQDEARSLVDAVANKLERDEPYEAQEVVMEHLDLTGAYRLMAVLLTEPPVKETVSVRDEWR